MRGGAASGLAAAHTGTVASSKMQGSSGGAQLQNWSYSQKTTAACFDAHEGGDEGGAAVCSLAFHKDNRTLASRAQDGSLKLWDVRQMSKPVARVADLPAIYDETACGFSPDGTLAYAAVSAPASGGGGGALAFFDSKTLRPVSRVGFPGSAVAVCWHARLNQVFVGCAQGRTGETRVLYDPVLSSRGVLLGKNRTPRSMDAGDVAIAGLYQGAVHNPNALPMFRETIWGTRKRARDGTAVARAHVPERAVVPKGEKGRAGELGSSAKAELIKQVVAQSGGWGGQLSDAREAFLRHADDAAEEKEATEKKE